MRNRVILLVSLVLLVSASYLFCAEDPVPKFYGYVNDYANIISSDGKAQITSTIVKLKERTKAEIAVLTVDSVKPYNIQEYAQMVFDKWKIGDKKLNNGVLFVVAVKDKKLWIATGYGVEGVLPDSKLGRIRDENIIPFFKKGDFSSGISNGVNSLASSIDKEFAKDYPSKSFAKNGSTKKRGIFQDSILALLVPIFIIIVIAVRLFSFFGGHNRYGRGGYWYGGGFGGGFGGGSDGGGFGGFGGGDSGGGGAGGDW